MDVKNKKYIKKCQFKTKYSELKDYALSLGNISKDFTIDNVEKQG